MVAVQEKSKISINIRHPAFGNPSKISRSFVNTNSEARPLSYDDNELGNYEVDVSHA
jgi:hypothetical protein